MTKKKRFLALLMVLALCVCTTALADASDTIQLQLPADFILSGADVSETGTFLLAGRTGKPQSCTAALAMVEEDGNIIGRTSNREEGFLSSLYRTAHWLDEDTFIALYTGTTGDNSSSSHAEIVELGMITSQFKSMDNIYSNIFPAEDGFFAFCKEDSSTAQIERMDIEGNALWGISFMDDPIMVNGIASADGIHVAFGGLAKDHDADPVSFVLAFDDAGNILWRYDGAQNQYKGEHSEYVEATWTEQGHIVLIGNTYPTEPFNKDSDQWISSFITEYDENGEVWRSDYRYTSGRNISEGRAQSVVSVDEGYIVASIPKDYDASVKLLAFDKTGSLERDWRVSTGELVSPMTVMLRKVNERVYMIANGYPEIDMAKVEDGSSYIGAENITILKNIRIAE